MKLVLAVIGFILLGTSMYVLKNSKDIMDRYIKNHTPPDSPVLRKLTEASEGVYSFNVRVLWPLIMLLGLYLIFLGFEIV